MKRYERMSREEIISVYNSVLNGDCGECHARNWCNDITTKFTCAELMAEWMNKEIKMKKAHRYELIKSPEDVDKLQKEFKCACDNSGCRRCKYYNDNEVTTASCFVNFLKEEIEVEDETI